MAASIADLTPEQAQAALLKFYELLPASMWGGAKPSWTALDGLAEDLESEAESGDSAELAREIAAVRNAASADPARRGELARILLANASAIEPLRPYLDRAIESALAPKMVPIPLVIGAVMMAVAVMPKVTSSTGKEGETRIEIDPTGNLVRLIDALREFVKEVPKDLVAGLVKGASNVGG
ncbi:MAG: hypothetical protein U0800_03015 [Isosphaeraceae bacterium]